MFILKGSKENARLGLILLEVEITVKNLSVIAMGRNTSIAFREQLYRLFGNRVNVSNYDVTGNLPTEIEGDLIVVSSTQVEQLIRPYLRENCVVITARRSIDYHEVHKLFEILADTDVLLVNDMQSTTHQTIALLQTLGIDHINYHPYVPSMANCPPLKIAVTPGERELVPDFVEQIIDIKTRLIDITTLVEILIQLDLLAVYAEFLSANYVKDIIGLIKASTAMLHSGNKIKSQLQTIINTVHDGIIATDEQGRITVFNPVAETLLDIEAKSVLGYTSAQLTNQNLLHILGEESSGLETLLKVNQHRLIFNITKMYPEKSNAAKVYTFKDVSEIRRLEETIRRKFIHEQKISRYTFAQILGQSPAIQETLAIARKMADSNSTILIQGESGTGKEMIAQGIHHASPRCRGPFIAVNFAALTESLLESELFGYIEGAFTGANRGGTPGLFEEAHKGTIFLDEIGDAPLSFQVKLLRVLQEQQVRRIGSSKTIPIDVRVIVATNRDLKKLIAEGLFRQDLYYRLNVLPIKVPPLRDRADDILLLAKAFYQSNISKPTHVSADLYFSLVTPNFLQYNWPGNIRELHNVVEYLMHVSSDLPPELQRLPEDLRSMELDGGVSFTENKQLRELVYQKIMRANQRNLSIGRRSLAEKLNLSENKIRKILQDLQQEGLILLQKGRKGLKINVDKVE